MEQEIINLVAPLGVGGALAAVIFYIYRKDSMAWVEAWKGQSEILMGVVKQNTIAVTSNTEAVRAMHKRLDQIERSGK